MKITFVLSLSCLSKQKINNQFQIFFKKVLTYVITSGNIIT